MHRPYERGHSAAFGTKTYAHPLIGPFTLDWQVLRLPEDDQLLMVLTAPPDTGSLEAPTGSARPPPESERPPPADDPSQKRPIGRSRTSAALDLRRAWTPANKKTRQHASYALLPQHDGLQRPGHPVRVCAEPRKVAGDCFRLLSGAGVHERFGDDPALRRRRRQLSLCHGRERQHRPTLTIASTIHVTSADARLNGKQPLASASSGS